VAAASSYAQQDAEDESVELLGSRRGSAETAAANGNGIVSGINGGAGGKQQQRSRVLLGVNQPHGPFPGAGVGTGQTMSFRFSAGDADKLEKGLRGLPSTRSLRDSSLK